MAIQILMPALSPTMEEGTLAKWLVKEGDQVKSGQIIAEIETDKATMEFEAVDEGIVGKILIAEGTDVTLVSFGIGVAHALAAAGELAKEGIEAEVINLRTLRPIDYDTVLASVQKTNRCVTVEEGFPVGSIGDHLASTIMQRAFDYLDAPVITCTGKDVPMPYAANLEKFALITPAEVVTAVKSVCYR